MNPDAHDVYSGLAKGTPEEQMEIATRTENAQPGILIASVYTYMNMGANKGYDYLMGHSLGEYTALVCAEMLDIEKTARLLRRRGECMQEAADNCGKQTAMVALVLPKKVNIRTVVELCEGWEGANVANINSEGQIVLSGEKKAIEELILHLKEQKVRVLKAIPLNVSAPFHSPIMTKVVDQLDQECQKLNLKPDFSKELPEVISNASGKPFGSSDEIYESIIRSPIHTVDWLAGVDYLRSQGVTTTDGFGPGAQEFGKFGLSGDRFSVEDVATTKGE